jgi:hypothetical protein
MRAALVAAVVAFALAAAGSAAARDRIRLTPGGNLAAAAVVLQRSDLGNTAGWSGGPTSPQLSSWWFLACRYKPRQSDLTMVGAAESLWSRPGVQLETTVQVLKTRAMVRRDWARAVVARQVTPCLRAAARVTGGSARFVSLRRVDFPRVGDHTRVFRIRVDFPTPGKTVQAFRDLVVLTRGRTEITLALVAPLGASAGLRPIEVRLARLLASRAV